MTRYLPPLADMRFVLEEVAGMPDVRQLTPFAEVTEDLVGAILEEAGRFAAEVLAPLNRIGDRQGCRLENGSVRIPDGFAEAYRQFVAGGWSSLLFPPSVGGQGLPHAVYTAVGELWTASNMAFALCPMLTSAAAELLLRAGDPALRRQYLGKLVSGTWTGTMNLTEPQAGSDLSLVRTQAVPEGDHFRITGQKIFITYGDHDLTENILHFLLARTPNAPRGLKGISLFAVPKVLVTPEGGLGPRNDVRCVSLERKLGIHGSPTAVMSFGEQGGAIGYLLGELHHGLELMFQMMNFARLAVGLEGVGIADRAYQQARTYAQERIQGHLLGSPQHQPVAICRHPDVQRMLLSMRAKTEAARALAYLAAATLDLAAHHPDEDIRRAHQARVDLLIPVVKGWCTEVGIQVANTAIQVHGGLGYIEESGVPQHFRDSRVAAIYEGTNGIQAMDLVSRKVMRDEGRAMGELITDMRQGIAILRATGGSMAGLADRLDPAVRALEASTAWILATYPSRPRTVAAGAIHYLDLAGTVVGGWLMARSALAAARRLGGDPADTDFLRAKIGTARFFAETELTRAAALEIRLRSVGEALASPEVEAAI